VTDAPDAPDAPDASVATAVDEVARGRRWFLVTLVVLAVGAGLLLLVAGRTWSTSLLGGGDVPTITVSLSGGDLMAAGAVALLVLAGIAGLLATRRAGRVVVGLLLVLAGLGVVVVAGDFGTTWSSTLGAGDDIQGLVFERAGIEGSLTTTITPWWSVAVVAGLVVMAGGILAIVTSRAWPRMGRRYERREGAERQERDVAPRSAWDQLDEGVDPTAGPEPQETGDTTGDTAGDPTLRAGGDS
jgi:uncharacterized membrane protein (TIGR02234 family)